MSNKNGKALSRVMEKGPCLIIFLELCFNCFRRLIQIFSLCFSLLYTLKFKAF